MYEIILLVHLFLEKKEKMKMKKDKEGWKLNMVLSFVKVKFKNELLSMEKIG